MASLKEVRIRINSVESTKQITNAMKMVSASKLRRAQNAILKLRPYENKLQEIMNNLINKVKELPQLDFASQREIKKALVVVFTSNKGLCGNYNSLAIKTAVEYINENFKELYINKNVDVITIGKKATEYFRKRDYNLTASYDDIYMNLTFDNVEIIAASLMEKYLNKEYDNIIIVYNRFKNAATQIISCETFLPILIKDNPNQGKKKSEIDYLYEPGKEEIVMELVPKILKLRFYRALLDSHASEHGARMTAMHKATDNATELLKDLKLYYNKVRQASITKEILEIVSGAEALKG
ncbi:MAG: ATP synthase F1 subunit gamma [Bacteroidales bacterium]|nr:ATP synthase F1 subunit gamma [Bacteroidales bacterium]